MSATAATPRSSHAEHLGGTCTVLGVVVGKRKGGMFGIPAYYLTISTPFGRFETRVVKEVHDSVVDLEQVNAICKFDRSSGKLKGKL